MIAFTSTGAARDWCAKTKNKQQLVIKERKDAIQRDRWRNSVSKREREREKRRELPPPQSCGIARIMSRRKQATPRSLRRKYTDIIYIRYLPPIYIYT